MWIVFAILVFCIGMFTGFLLRYLSEKRKLCSGTIYVDQRPDKLVYTLELVDNPENLKNKEKISFRVAPLDSRE